jgi:hypothetical protein
MVPVASTVNGNGPTSGHSPPGAGARPTGTLAGKPTLIQWNKLRFLVMDSPRVSVGCVEGC